MECLLKIIMKKLRMGNNRQHILLLSRGYIYPDKVKKYESLAILMEIIFDINSGIYTCDGYFVIEPYEITVFMNNTGQHTHYEFGDYSDIIEVLQDSIIYFLGNI